MSVEGIDVSEFSLDIDWQQVKDNGIHFCYARVNDGTTHLDSYFQSYWSGMKKAGIMRGSYFFFRPSQDIYTQVRLFAQGMDFETGDLPPVVDVEANDEWNDWSTTGSINRLVQCLMLVEIACGHKPIIYTSPFFWQDQMGDTSLFAQHNYDLWIANYDTNTPIVPGNWNVYTFHQYIGDETGFPGIEGNVDRNRFNGALDRLHAECIKAVPLTEGRISPKVRKLQYFLTKLAEKSSNSSFNPGSIDGIFGPATKRALVAYQRMSKLKITGSINVDDKILA